MLLEKTHLTLLVAEILGHHGAADGVVEVAVLGKRRQRQLVVDLVEAAVQWADKLHAADSSEQVGRRLVGGGVLGPQRHNEVGRLDLDVLRVEETVGRGHLLRLLDGDGLIEALELAEEDELLVGSPVLDIVCGGLVIWRLPLRSQPVADINQAGVKVGLGRHARAVEAALPVDALDLVCEIGVLGLCKELEEGVAELERVERLEAPFGKVECDKLVKVVAADKLVEVVDHVESLLVGHGAESVVGVDAVVVDAELGVLVVRAKSTDSILCIG